MIDCDVHNTFNGVHDLMDWIDPPFRPYLLNAGYRGFQLPNYIWNHPAGFTRKDAVPEHGEAGSDYVTTRAQLLDEYDIEYAILNGEDILLASSLAHPQLAAALVTAYNRWLVDVWLARDTRFKGSMMVATQDVEQAVKEIQTVGRNDAIVQVLLPSGSRAAYGTKQYFPIFEAATTLGLAVAIHPAGEGLGMNAPATATGNPTYYAEWHTLLCQHAMSHLVSLVMHGVFARLPELRFVMIESGVTWVPAILWRMDDNWKELRSEVPWVKRLPSETAREQVRITTQPLEQPANLRSLHMALEAFDGLGDMLMFASDYPHWDFDNPPRLARRLPKSWQTRVMGENARELYRLPTSSPRQIPEPVGTS